MTRRSKIWLVVAWVFTAINLVGGVQAVVAGEMAHAGTHVVLFAVGAYFVLRLRGRSSSQQRASVQLPKERLDQLQQSVDALALAVERIGESQRYSAKIIAERSRKHADESLPEL